MIVRMFEKPAVLETLPPTLVTVGKVMARKVKVADAWRTRQQAREVQRYLAHANPDEAPEERETRVRELYDMVLAQLDLDDVPSAAIEPIVDYFVAKVLAEWNAEHASQAPPLSGTAPPNEV